MQLKIYGKDWLRKLTKLHMELPDLYEQAGEISLSESIVIAYLVKKFTPEYIFEIGTFRGRTTATMALNTNGRLKNIYTLDVLVPPDDLYGEDQDYCNPENVGEVYRNAVDAKSKKKMKSITQLWGDSREFDFTPYHGKMDMVFVDGGHSYDVCISDVRNAQQMVSDEGIILIHDFAMWKPDVMNAVMGIAVRDDLALYVFQDTTLVGLGDTLEKFYAED